jgi:quercetin dioxygenase-like cupin family protein
MKTIMCGLGLLAVGFVGGAFAKEAAQKEIVQKTVADLEWKTVTPGVPVVSSEDWKGSGGAHCTWNKFPRGFSSPAHYHSKDLHSVVVAGHWGSWVEGAPEKLVGPGGYEFIPAGLKHTTKCSDAADCVTYECSPGAFDLKGLPPLPK